MMYRTTIYTWFESFPVSFMGYGATEEDSRIYALRHLDMFLEQFDSMDYKDVMLSGAAESDCEKIEQAKVEELMSAVCKSIEEKENV